MKCRHFILLTVLTLFLAGCFSSQAPTVMTSTSPVPIGTRGTIPAYGSDCQYFLLGLLPITFSPNTTAALDEAKRDAGCKVLTDVTIDDGSFYWLLFSTQCVRVRGLGVPDSQLLAPVAGS